MPTIKLDIKQEAAIRSAFENSITVITGPAGSGKSMICRYIVKIAEKLHQTVRLMTPTGKAAQVLSDKTGCPASTIHRSLKLKKGMSEKFDVNVVPEIIREDIVIIDEVSMCGIDTFFPVMRSLENSPNTRLVLVGDKNQLPSVSPGNFINDIMESGCANVVSLNRIYRQDEKSYISLVANDISNGKVANIPHEATDIKWHNLNESTFRDDISSHIDELLSTGHKISDIQLVAPMKKGEFGIFALNKFMQEKMVGKNGTQNNYMVYGFNKFYLKDRVMQVENNYKKDVFNGDMGEVVDVGEMIIDASISDKKAKYIKVNFYGQTITYFGDEVDELQLAWCCTVHKYQGSQSPCIIMMMSNESNVMMSKELIYTAFTRASKRLDVFGHLNMLRIAPTRSSVKKRYTNMIKIINEKRTGNKILQVRNSSN